MFEIKSGDKTLSLTSPVVMAIINVTPDSFSDGGQHATVEQACAQIDKVVSEGALIVDIGGESTRPGAEAVSVEEELSRVIPVIEYTAKQHDVWISIDTSKPEVMEKAVAAGAHLINDVRALQEPGAVAMATSLDVPVCLMHMQGQPQNMQDAPQYEDVMQQVTEFLSLRVDYCLAAGMPRENIILDPGFGFGKTLEHNYQLLAKLPELHSLHLPVLIGLSRKSMIGDLLQRDTNERLAGSLAGAMIAAQQGAQILRVHDVKETVDVLKVMSATMASLHQ
ncbi:dihydropteroate synthase [Shewanella sp. 1_MG-2023]|uniref:Dihydropteroate synthase n=1 Tax=Shewanella electrodiphila TaxID=934143 RepID=A0ABT0KL77_9GAMM|nr:MULTISPECIES: dihydropteroate synthase [unclassified Shewanella]MCL1044583.1 dihydropteroate synthase [Shewanella electrodiphila]MDO6610342.1 dihydropteroate synthase [Shewanella sp. 7_MG-2023]MDO6770467.1 dihydropteroate synthase [Shewanella sp. 2_MG-2023]MDO6794354.1 dihydropteroate synthase [Shewanella sp. 1_MG-2023]PMG78763.1 dihydropteroate synthase [Shewanella sp. 10N.286.51.B7]